MDRVALGREAGGESMSNGSASAVFNGRADLASCLDGRKEKGEVSGRERALGVLALEDVLCRRAG